jgi:hypothetical protein
VATSNLKHTWSTSIKNDSGTAVLADPPLVIVGDAESNFSTIVAAGETAEVDIPITVANIQSGFITATKDVTVKTNAADASGGQTIVVPAGKSVAWNNTQTTVNPFTPNITKFFIHNAGSLASTVRGGFLLVE